MANPIHVNLRIIREKHRYSQSEVAAIMGMTQSTYAKLEAGTVKIKLDAIEAFCKELGISITDLLLYPEKWARIDAEKIDGEYVQESPAGDRANMVLIECEHYKTLAASLQELVSEQKETIAFLRKLVTDFQELVKSGAKN